MQHRSLRRHLAGARSLPELEMAFTVPRVAREYVIPAPRVVDPRITALMHCFTRPLGEGDAPRTLTLAAHPDDETIGVGGMFPRLDGQLTIVHVTDGAPRFRR